MGRKKPGAKLEFVAYDVTYEDGSQTSNRRIPAGEISQFEADDSVRAFFEAQDTDIAEKGGRKRGAIKSFEVRRNR